jgi:hypothetical protein
MKVKTKQKTKTLILPETQTEGVWKVTLFNCFCHKYDDVVEQIAKAICCSMSEAYIHTDHAEKFGFVDLFEGSYSESSRVAEILGRTGMDVRMSG